MCFCLFIIIIKQQQQKKPNSLLLIKKENKQTKNKTGKTRKKYHTSNMTSDPIVESSSCHLQKFVKIFVSNGVSTACYIKISAKYICPPLVFFSPLSSVLLILPLTTSIFSFFHVFAF